MPVGAWGQRALSLHVSKDMANSVPAQPAVAHDQMAATRSRKKQQVTDTGQRALCTQLFESLRIHINELGA